MLTEKPSRVRHDGLQIFSIDIKPSDLRFATRGGDQKDIAVDDFYAGDGTDHSEVPTKMVTLNCSLTMIVYNIASMFSLLLLYICSSLQCN